MIRKSFIASALVAAIALAACGGGSKPPSTAVAAKGKKEQSAANPAAEAAAKKHNKPAETKDVAVKDDEIDLNTGATVDFSSGSDQLTDESYLFLDEVAAVLDEHKDIKIRVEGYTDNDGPEDANFSLSAKRADAVADYLIAWGIDAARVDSWGCGPLSPVGDNKTADGKKANRRVEFIIVGKRGRVCGVEGWEEAR